jgi:threonyl-tRNA synthetase
LLHVSTFYESCKTKNTDFFFTKKHKYSYEKLGFGNDFAIRLATRPSQYVGALELWDLAESMLKTTLQAFGRPWTVQDGDGR